MLQCSALVPASLLKLSMELYNLRSSFTTPFCWGLLPGSIKSNPDGLKMCFLLPLIVICLLIIRKDKCWLREILLAVNNVIKNKSEVPALHGANLHRAPRTRDPPATSVVARAWGQVCGGAHPGVVLQLLLGGFMGFCPDWCLRLPSSLPERGLPCRRLGVLWGQEVAHGLERSLSPRSLEAFGLSFCLQRG